MEGKCKARRASRIDLSGEGDEEATVPAPVIHVGMQGTEESGCLVSLVCAAGSDGWGKVQEFPIEQFLLDCPCWDAEVMASSNTAWSLTCVGHHSSIDCDEKKGLERVSISDTWAQCAD